MGSIGRGPPSRRSHPVSPTGANLHTRSTEGSGIGRWRACAKRGPVISRDADLQQGSGTSAAITLKQGDGHSSFEALLATRLVCSASLSRGSNRFRLRPDAWDASRSALSSPCGWCGRGDSNPHGQSPTNFLTRHGFRRRTPVQGGRLGSGLSLHPASQIEG